jgi:hypothetical protein
LKHIVITSINKPTTAIEEFSKWSDFSLIVVGDKKSPESWEHAGANFLSHSSPQVSGFEIFGNLNFNHYSRKMLGYLWAIRNGATLIYDTDDDNIPRSSGYVPEFQGDFELVSSPREFYNVYSDFSDSWIWPRGFPIDDLHKQSQPNRRMASDLNVGIWQGLVDQDPDVDAIYRLLYPGEIVFNARPPIVLDDLTWCPFNSQNTFFSKDYFACLYLPTGVTFRFTDILRSIVAQPILWSKGSKLGFLQPEVFQIRNEHNLMDDFRSEVPMHLSTKEACEIALDSVKKDGTPSENLYLIYEGLAKSGIVPSEELNLVESWIRDLERLS